MNVYEIYDYDTGSDSRYYRSLKEAKADFAGVTSGRLTKITIQTPITKDIVIALLNQEGYAVEQEELIVR